MSLPAAELPVGKEALTVTEAARALSIGKTLAYELIASGEIPNVKLGARTLVPRAALVERLTVMSRRPRVVTRRRRSR